MKKLDDSTQLNEDKIFQRLEELSKAKNLSQYRLAKKSNIPLSSLNALIRHRHLPTLPTLFLICKGLNITLSEFFEYNNDFSENEQINFYYNILSDEEKEKLLIYAKGLTRL